MTAGGRRYGVDMVRGEPEPSGAVQHKRPMTVSVVVLTMGDRPAELNRAVRGALDQRDVVVQVVVVGNGADLPDLPDGVVTLRLPENLGIPGGRNKGVAAATGEIVVFLDDDGWYAAPDVLREVAARFEADPRLGIVSMRIRDPEGGPGARRHVPRLRAADPSVSSEVTTFLGGASAVRRSVFNQVGGLPEEFFYAHEETDLAWRVLDAGYRIWYDADAVMYHPAVAPTRHADFYYKNARNRVWLARRNLPWPLATVYLLNWAALMVARERTLAALRPWLAGFREGWRTECGPRHPISYRTAWRMTRLGRPPII